MTMVSVHRSCHGLHGFPKALKTQKGTALLNPLEKAVPNDISLPSRYTALVLVIHLPTDLPLNIPSINDIKTA